MNAGVWCELAMLEALYTMDINVLSFIQNSTLTKIQHQNEPSAVAWISFGVEYVLHGS